MRFLLLLCIGSMLGHVGVGHAAETAAEPDAASAIIGNLSFPFDVEVEFQQLQLNPLFKQVATQRGVMLKTTDQGLIMRVSQPRTEERRIFNGTVSVTRSVRHRNKPGFRTATQSLQLDPDKPMHLVLLALESLLNGKYAVLHRHFDISAQPQTSGWRIRLEPKKPELRSQVSRLWFAGLGDQLHSFRSERDDGSGGFSHFLEVQIHPPTAAAPG